VEGNAALRFVVLLVVGALGLGIAIAIPIILPVFRFAVPGGPFAVGTVTYYWVDATRAEILGIDPNGRRELMVQIWYPVGADSAAPHARYLPDADALITALAKPRHLSEFLFAHLKYVTTHAVPSAAVATAHPG
jgi:hypothetical protein